MFRFVCMVSCLLAITLAKDLIIENKRGDTIYVGTLSNALKAPLANGGFALGPGESVSLFTNLIYSNSTRRFFFNRGQSAPLRTGRDVSGAALDVTSTEPVARPVTVVEFSNATEMVVRHLHLLLNSLSPVGEEAISMTSLLSMAPMFQSL